MKLTYSKPVAEIEEFALVDILTISQPTGNENIEDQFPGDSQSESGEDSF